MKGVKRLTTSSYEIGDFVAVVDDSHVFAGKDLQNGRGEENLGAITINEQSKLVMQDEGLKSFRATMAISAFRSQTSKEVSIFHRRKYSVSNNKVTLKSNAGVN